MNAKVVSLLAVFLLSLGFWAWSADLPKDPKPTEQSPDTAPPTARVVGPLSEADAQALATMTEELREYVDLREKIKRELPRLPLKATAQQIDYNQREFEKSIRIARAGAKQGDIFTSQAQPVIRRLLFDVFDGPEGKQVKTSILDVNTAGLETFVNERYPDSVAVSNMPLKVLQTLPRLPSELQYRFVGNRLIILDTYGKVVAASMPNAIP